MTPRYRDVLASLRTAYDGAAGQGGRQALPVTDAAPPLIGA